VAYYVYIIYKYINIYMFILDINVYHFLMQDKNLFKIYKYNA